MNIEQYVDSEIEKRSKWGATLQVDRDYLVKIIKMARGGELHKYLNFWNESEYQPSLSFADRSIFTKTASWAIYTQDYMVAINSLVKFLAPKKIFPKVLEVCAGNGLLHHMEKKFSLTWKCTDKEGTDHVEELEAEDAIAKYSDFDVLFCSWPPYDNEIDNTIAELWTSMGKPCIFITEGEGGCIGSTKFWKNPKYKIDYADEVIEGFADVRSWNGIGDYTIVVRPR